MPNNVVAINNLKQKQSEELESIFISLTEAVDETVDSALYREGNEQLATVLDHINHARKGIRAAQKRLL